jgi:ankyrin repeat protein
MEADSNVEQQAEFVDAVRRGDTSLVARLSSRHPELVQFADTHGKTALHRAAEVDQAEVARLLLDGGAEIEARTSWGASPLDWAATMGSTRVAELLLSRGAGGLTLVVAAALGKLDQVRATIVSGADLSDQRRRGAPELPDEHWPGDSAHLMRDVVSDAMYAAARNGHTQVVEFLLDRRAAVDAKGVFGGTALHWAAINGHRSTADLLLARGASLVIRDARFNATPAEWAREGGHTEMAEALRPDGDTA